MCINAINNNNNATNSLDSVMKGFFNVTKATKLTELMRYAVQFIPLFRQTMAEEKLYQSTKTLEVFN